MVSTVTFSMQLPFTCHEKIKTLRIVWKRRNTPFHLFAQKFVKQSYFIVGSNTTRTGLANQFFERCPKYVLVDKLEKMSNGDQTSLIYLMETGIIIRDKDKEYHRTKLGIIGLCHG